LEYRPSNRNLKIVKERSNDIERQNILDIFILKTVKHNKLRKFKLPSFGLLSGYRQTYALFKTYKKPTTLKINVRITILKFLL
jgi:hypothetical protein